MPEERLKLLQASLRDANIPEEQLRGIKMPGYFRISLRDNYKIHKQDRAQETLEIEWVVSEMASSQQFQLRVR